MVKKRSLHFSTHMGRMGNQMFQYACAKAMEWEYGFVSSLSHLDKVPYFVLERGEHKLNRIKSFIFFRLLKPLFGFDTLNTEFACLQEDFKERLIQLERPTNVLGYFQSPLYFESSEEKLRRCFEVKRSYYVKYNDFLKRHQLQPGSYLAVHVRRTDYKGFTVAGLNGDDFTLPIQYYHKALYEIKWQGPIVFVSDEPNAIPSLFPGINERIVSSEDAITDFLILRHAGACILSNSTFAWWAGWLNKDVSKVLCPKYFLGFKESKEVPINIYPKNWTQIEINEN